jgi:hypothetical protein
MFFAAECVAWMQMTLTTVLLGRAVWRPQPPPPPDGPAADVLVTVCGEPLSMVERTVRAALAIRYPHQTYVVNDGMRAGLADWAEVNQLARRLGVECLTRRDGPAGKAGNLNSALRRTSGEFVLTIDADHVAHPDFLDDTLGWFTDSGVTFVATPQAFQVDADDPFNMRIVSSTTSCNRPKTGNPQPSRAATAASTGVARWQISAGSANGISSRTCTRRIACMRRGGAASITHGHSRWEVRRLFQPCTSSSPCDGRSTASGYRSSTIPCGSPDSPWCSAFNTSIPRALICSLQCSTSSS